MLLIVSVVLLACSLLKKVSGRLGIPSLLMFILLGMLFGSDGLFKIPFDDYAFAEQISSVALVFIMFYGGFGTNWKAARPVAAVSVVLSSAGTVLTALLTGLFCHFVLGMPILEGLLCGAVLGSTDAASVFSILRSRRLALKENTAPLLEVESGSNDPFAYMLTVVLLSAMETGVTVGGVVQMLAGQVVLGLAFGFGIGFGVRWLMRRFRLDASGMETLFMVGTALLAYAAPTMLGGNGFLSVYIAGIVLGNSNLAARTTLVPFFDGVTGNMQAVLFFLLGLLSYPSRMASVLLPGLAIAVFLAFVARPAAVFALMTPFGGSVSRRLLVSFSGLRGAASIVFAIVAVQSPAAMENDLFHIAFVVVLFSIALQGSLLPAVARRLDMIDEGGNVLKTFTDYVDETPVNFVQLEVEEGHPWCGRKVAGLELPPGTILVSLRRGDTRMVPKGDTCLQAGDLLVMCALERHGGTDFCLTERVVEADELTGGATLADLPDRPGSLIVLIRRGHDCFIPDGSTVLQPGDHLLINRTDETAAVH